MSQRRKVKKRRAGKATGRQDAVTARFEGSNKEKLVQNLLFCLTALCCPSTTPKDVGCEL